VGDGDPPAGEELPSGLKQLRLPTGRANQQLKRLSYGNVVVDDEHDRCLQRHRCRPAAPYAVAKSVADEIIPPKITLATLDRRRGSKMRTSPQGRHWLVPKDAHYASR